MGDTPDPRHYVEESPNQRCNILTPDVIKGGGPKTLPISLIVSRLYLFLYKFKLMKITTIIITTIEQVPMVTVTYIVSGIRVSGIWLTGLPFGFEMVNVQ